VRRSRIDDNTALLAAWSRGVARALDHLAGSLYPKLRAMAQQALAHRRPGESLESAALTNEAYLKLVRAGAIRCENRVHFLALCSQIMWRILVNHARDRGAAKRGGNAVRVTLTKWHRARRRAGSTSPRSTRRSMRWRRSIIARFASWNCGSSAG
jgi:RNA polymerase sigma factor (TIGR02999 family)